MIAIVRDFRQERDVIPSDYLREMMMEYETFPKSLNAKT